jgi:hypothetical protein
LWRLGIVVFSAAAAAAGKAQKDEAVVARTEPPPLCSLSVLRSVLWRSRRRDWIWKFNADSRAQGSVLSVDILKELKSLLFSV